MFSTDESYAVHWVPPGGDPLVAFGHGWTGWCADSGEKQDRIGSPAGGIDLVTLTKDISRHGLHAELHPPFHLKDPGKTWVLNRTLTMLADLFREVSFRGLELAVVDGRVSLVPIHKTDELDTLARRVREALEPLVVPQKPRERETARRIPGLAVAIRPEGCFHMPLTDRLPQPTACQVAERLRSMVRDVLDGSHLVGDIALVSDPGTGRRPRIAEHFPLSDEVARGSAYACRGPRVLTALAGADRSGIACV